MQKKKLLIYFVAILICTTPFSLFAQDDKYIDNLQKELENEITNVSADSKKPYDYTKKEAGKETSSLPKDSSNKDGNALGKMFNSIENKKNTSIQFFINYYSGFGKSGLEASLSRLVQYYPVIQKYAKKYNLPSEIMLVGILESNYIATATTPKGGKGIWNIMPTTAKIYNLSMTDYLDERMDVEKSTDAAFSYIASLRDSFHDNWDLVLAAYNGGGAYINEKIRKYKTSDFWALISQDPNFKNDTLEFVPRFYAILTLVKNASHYNLSIPSVFNNKTQFDSIVLAKDGVAFKDIATQTNIDVKTLMELNPQLYREFTVSNANLYVPAKTSKLVSSRIRMARATTLRWYPQGSQVSLGNYVVAYHRAPAQSRSHIVYYSVKKKDTLYSIAHRYNVAVADIKRLNHLSGNALSVGSTLKIAKASGKSYSKVNVKSGTTAGHRYKVASNKTEKHTVTKSYIVKKGDTLYSISKKYNVAVNKIKTVNGNSIKPGDKLIIQA